MMVHLTVKTTSGKKIDLEIALESSVAQCKAALVPLADVPAELQRLIYKGKVLKDELTLESYGVAADDTIYFVRGSASSRLPASAGPSMNTTAAAPGPSAHATPPPANPSNFPLFPLPTGATSSGTPAANPLANIFGSGMGGAQNMAPNMAALQQQMMQNPEMMRQMMDSPMVQTIMSNPDIMRSMMQSNPAIQQMLEQNPQLNHVLNDPELLRQSMEAMRNPAAMREMMRNQDTALRNIESHPEGFNALRRMYHDVQEPLLDAAASGSRPPSGSAFAMPGVAGGTSSTSEPATTPSTTSAPAAVNPWATSTSNSTAVTNNPWGGMPSPAALVGLGGGLGAGGANPEMMAQLLQSPLMQPMLDQIANNPQHFISQMEAMNPQMAAMMNANPQMRQMMMSPDFLRSAMNPHNIQAMMQMQSAMNQLRGSGLIPGLESMNLGAGPAPGAAGAAAPNAFDFSSLLGGGGAFGAPGTVGANPFGGAVAPAANPEELYASQLVQLQDMGFTSREQNLRALQAAAGNVHAAVERLLSGLN